MNIMKAISKHLLPVLFLLMASLCACDSNKGTAPQTTVISEPEKSPKTAITLYLQPYNGFPENKILQLQTDVQHCLDTLIPEQKFVVKVRKNLDLPEYCWYPPRSRYRADSILLFQHRMDGKNYTTFRRSIVRTTYRMNWFATWHP